MLVFPDFFYRFPHKADGAANMNQNQNTATWNADVCFICHLFTSGAWSKAGDGGDSQHCSTATWPVEEWRSLLIGCSSASSASIMSCVVHHVTGHAGKVPHVLILHAKHRIRLQTVESLLSNATLPLGMLVLDAVPFHLFASI